MDYDVVHVEALEHLCLKVSFRAGQHLRACPLRANLGCLFRKGTTLFQSSSLGDGLTGVVCFEDSHLTGVFEPLKNPDFFARVGCANGFVEWPEEIDLAPDAMHDALKQSGAWVLS